MVQWVGVGWFSRSIRSAECCSVLQCVAECGSVLQCVAVRCSVLQCVAVCCSELQCVGLVEVYAVEQVCVICSC